MIKSNPKILKYTFLLVALVLTLSPFLYLAQFNHPSADDFCYTNQVNQLGFVAAQVEQWFAWSGRYTATALLSIITVDHNDLFVYRIVPVFLLIGFAISIFVFLKSLVPKASTYDICALSFVIFFLFLFKAPNISEAFYWLPGSATYQLASILSLVLFSVIINLFRQKKKLHKILSTILGALLGVAIVGLNEIALIYLCMVLFLWLFIKVSTTRKPDYYLITIVIFTFIAAVFAIAAPGNYVRMSKVMAEQFNFAFSVSGSVKLAFWRVVSWLPLLILLVIIFWNSFKRVASRLKYYYNIPSISWPYLVFLILFLFGTLALGYFPTFWSQGWHPPTRTINTIFLVFLIGSVGIILIFMSKIREIKIPLQTVPVFARILAVLVIISYLSFLNNNIKIAYKDIVTGKAMKYDKEMQERFSRLNNCEEGLCDIPRLENHPNTIFAYELALQPTEEIYYYNQCLEFYFQGTYPPELGK